MYPNESIRHFVRNDQELNAFYELSIRLSRTAVAKSDMPGSKYKQSVIRGMDIEDLVHDRSFYMKFMKRALGNDHECKILFII